MGYFTLTQTILFLGIGVTFHLLGLALYRIFLHPLSSVPGPRLAALTSWYPAFYAWKGELHLRNREWHERFGTYFRSGPNEVSFNSPEDLQKIYKSGVKPEIWSIFGIPRRSTVLSERNPHAHRFKRGRISKMFSDQNMGAVEQQALQHITKFVEVLGEQKHCIQDLCEWLSFDVISDLLFSQRPNMLTSPAARHIVNAYNSINLRSLVCLVQPKLYKWKMDRFLLFTKRKPIIAAGKWIAQNVRNRSESSEEYNDIYQFLTEAENTHETLHYDEKGLWAESMLLFAAGADTTSTTLSALFFYLLHNPTRLSRLEREIRETFKNESDITKFATGNGNDDKLQSCIYLQACVRETMRLVPAVTNLSPRLVRSGGMILAGTYVPHGTHVGGSLYTALRNKSHFEDPDAFDPERWIPEGESKPTKLKDWPGSIPFGTGLHSCVGKSLAKLQLELTVARTVFKYDLTLLGEACEDAVFPFNAWAVAKGKTAQTGAEYSAGLAY